MVAGEETPMTWEHFRHGADVGVRGIGASCDDAFEQIAIAMTAVIVDPTTVLCSTSIEIRCNAPDRELLLVDWLNALIYEMAARDMLFGRFDVTIRGHTLVATAGGEPFDRTRHQTSVEVKGATYSELCVARRDDGTWVAQTVVDV